MAWDKAQLVELLPGMQTALGLILSAAHNSIAMMSITQHLSSGGRAIR